MLALIGSLALAAVIGFILISVTPRAPDGSIAAENPKFPDPPYREAGADKESPTITSIESPSATCYLPTAGTAACYIQWDYLYVTAAPGAYVISMTVGINDRLRAYHSGFFQSAMFIPSGMTAPGYKVVCGVSNDPNMAGWGNTYRYTIRARDTTGTKAANYGSVTCPADLVHIYMPFVRRN